MIANGSCSHRSFMMPHFEIDHDTVGMQLLDSHHCIKTAHGRLNSVIVNWQQIHKSSAHINCNTNKQQPVPCFVFQLPKRHPVFFEEPDQVLSRYPAILRSRNTVSLKPARIEPLADGARCNAADP